MFTWDSVELAVDTPFDPAFPWLQPARTRGNLLSLDRRWLGATSPASPSLPVPQHLRLEWREGLSYWSDLDGLPYWSDQNGVELEAVWNYVHSLVHVLEEAGTRLTLDLAHWGYAAPGRRHPAFTPLYVPLFLPPRYPRYSHSHAGIVLAEHPPVVIQKPRGRNDLPVLVARALVEEGVAAWPAPGLIAPKGYAAIAVATAPWFGELPEDVSLTAQAIAKVDHFLFTNLPLTQHPHRHEHAPGQHHHAGELVQATR